VSDADDDSDDADDDLIDDNDDLVSVATTDAALVDSKYDESSATEEYPLLIRIKMTMGGVRSYRQLMQPRHSMQIMVLSFTCHPKLQLAYRVLSAYIRIGYIHTHSLHMHI